MNNQQKPEDERTGLTFYELPGGIVYASSVGEVVTVRVDRLTTKDAGAIIKVILDALNAHDWGKKE